MDITNALAPKSDQMDAVDLLGSSRTFTIARVSEGNAEQPVNVQLAEFPRPWRPSKSMLRVLANCWGTDASKWAGHRLTLFCDESVMFGGKAVGGIRVSHVSGIDKPKQTPLLVKRGQSALFRVEPLPDLTTVDRIAALGNEWRAATPERKTEIEAEVAALKAGEPS